MSGPAWFLVDAGWGPSHAHLFRIGVSIAGWGPSHAHLFRDDRPDLHAAPAACGYDPEAMAQTRWAPVRYVPVDPDETACVRCTARAVEGWPA